MDALSLMEAAVNGDDVAVRRILAADPAGASEALIALCFSPHLRGDPSRSENFVRAARALLDAGAGASGRALYGAAGVAHHAELTGLLLERGADANEDETVYHAPETYDNAAMKVLVGSGRLTEDSMATLLLRKHDWHDYDGVVYLLEHGADPNRMRQWGRTAMQQAVLRDNALEFFEPLLGHGGDAKSALSLAARRGRGDLLALFERRGVPIELHGVERLIAACARNESMDPDPRLVDAVVAEGGKLLAEFAGVGNVDGVRRLLDLGVDVGATFTDGDGYWGLGKNSTALHVAAWRARQATVQLLIERGAPVDARDEKGRTPLALAVRACVDSYWTHLRSPESVEALLRAGASPRDVGFPSGYQEVDELLRDYISP